MLTSIILPSRLRKNLLLQALQSIKDTCYGVHDVEVVTIIDEDLESQAELDAFYSTIPVNENWLTTSLYSERADGALKAWNLGLKYCEGDLIFPMGDDGLCHPGWLGYALESHRDKLGGYGLVGTNDLMLDGNKQLATHFLFDRKFCKEVLGGVIAYPAYNYYCIDMEINARAKRAGKFYWDDRAIVEHRHSANGKRPLDVHDLNRMSNNYMEIDNTIYKQREAAGFQNDFPPII